MRGQGHYPDSGVNPMRQPQNQYPLQQQSRNAHSTQDRIHQADNYPGASRPANGQWRRDRDWDHDSAKDPNKFSSYSVGYTEGMAASHSAEQKGTIGNNIALEGEYRDNVSLPQTFDSLEQSFCQDLTKLEKEHHAAEDAELSRHHERLNEINMLYQEKLVALRAKQGKMREEFLRKEAESRLQQYQQFQVANSMSHFPLNNPPLPLPGTLPNSAAGYTMEATQRAAYHGAYGSEGHPGGYGADAALKPTYTSQASRYESGGHAHAQGLEPRYPGGGAYNGGGRWY